MDAQKRQIILRRQSHAKGFILIAVALALFLSALAITYEGLRQREISYDKDFQIFGESVGRLQNAANAALSKYYSAFVSAPDAATSIGINVAADGAPPIIVNIADWRHPTITELISLGTGLPSNFKSSAPNGGQYRISLSKSPVGCAPSNCNIEGLVWVDKIISVAGVVDNERAAIAVKAIGADGGRSIAGTTPQEANTIIGWRGKWRVVNPVANMGGIVAARVGYGASAFAPYFRIDGTKQMAADGNFGGHSLVNAKQVLTVLKSVDSTCSDEGAIAGGIIAGKGAALVCSDLKWQPAGGSIKTEEVGAGCSPDGKSATNSAGQALICKNGTYSLVSSLIGNYAELGNIIVRDDMTLSLAGCDSPAQPVVFFDMNSTTVDFTVNPPMAAQYIRAVNTGGNSWRIELKLRANDGSVLSGNKYSLEAVMHYGCYR